MTKSQHYWTVSWSHLGDSLIQSQKMFRIEISISYSFFIVYTSLICGFLYKFIFCKMMKIYFKNWELNEIMKMLSTVTINSTNVNVDNVKSTFTLIVLKYMTLAKIVQTVWFCGLICNYECFKYFTDRVVETKWVSIHEEVS